MNKNEILFKGKREDTKEWVYGYYVRLPDAAGSVHMMHAPANNPDESNKAFYIDPETLGRFTGKLDKNGAKIFEGDKVKIYDLGEYGVVRYNDNFTEFYVDFSGVTYLQLKYSSKDIEVVGNIYDDV